MGPRQPQLSRVSGADTTGTERTATLTTIDIIFVLCVRRSTCQVLYCTSMYTSYLVRTTAVYITQPRRCYNSAGSALVRFQHVRGPTLVRSKSFVTTSAPQYSGSPPSLLLMIVRIVRTCTSAQGQHNNGQLAVASPHGK